MTTMKRLCLITLATGCLAATAVAQDAKLTTTELSVRVTSTAPSMAGQRAQLYVREVALPSTVVGGKAGADKVVLFVHGAGTPAEVSFDVPYQDYSWMAYLAKAGYDVFAMDTTGYGRSTRPKVMDNACNVPPDAQAQYVPKPLKATCPAAYTQPITTMGSDWDDIGAVVDHLRALRGVEKIALVGWSQGGPRTAGYTARNPAKISKLVVLAPAYNRTGPSAPPNPFPAMNGPMTSQTRADFDANWNRQVGCADQYDPAASAAVWSEMLASDPVGATWGPGMRRAPQVPSWGFNQAVVAKMNTPFLMIAGAHDKQVPPERVRDLYADLGSPQKVFVDLACSSHNAMWERNHALLFAASLEWLQKGTYNGQSKGEFKLGYAP